MNLCIFSKTQSRFPTPNALGGGEVAGRIEQVRKATLLPHFLESPVADLHCPAVAPDDGGAQHFVVFVQQHQPVHLVSDADALDFGGLCPRFCKQLLGGDANVLPPGIRVLLCTVGWGEWRHISCAGDCTTAIFSPLAMLTKAALMEEEPMS